MANIRTTQAEQPDLRSPRGLRSPSSSSDVMSASGRSLAGGVPAASPRPLYVAQTAAETLTSAEIDRSVVVTEAALDLVNGFLDQTLYSLLSVSKSTSLGAIRAAVPKLLKPRLGQAALSAGDEEVRDILEANDFGRNQVPTATTKSRHPDFDVELVWKLTRLRCMVYSRLGDMEEEDEEELVEQEGLSEHLQNPKTSTTPIEALFLAAILGFLGEQALCTAVQHAERRTNHHMASTDGEDSEADDEDDLILEPVDMLQLGREGPLSRLWRSWRRDTRSTDLGPSRPGSRGNALSSAAGDVSHARKTSLTSKEGAIPEEDTPKSITPSQIPLPMRHNDVDEIEVPGLAPPLDGEEDANLQIPERSKRRPSSVLIIPMRDTLPSSIDPEDRVFSERSPNRPQPSRNRSHSLPTSTSNRKRETVIFSPNDGPELDTDGTDQGDQSVRDSESAHQDEKAMDEKPHHRHSNARASIISGTVAAIAGALGIEAMKQSRTSKEHQDQTFNNTERGQQNKRSRTVAEEIMGPENHVAPPTDAETGASITGPSDFDSMHIPQSATSDERPESRGLGGADSDPEDLALSSADEENAKDRTAQPSEDSKYPVAEAPQRPSGHATGRQTVRPVQDLKYQDPGATVASRDYATERYTPSSPPSSPSSPKRAKREAAVYENHMIPMRSDDDEPDNSQVQTREMVPEQTSTSTNDKRASLGLPIQQPALEPATFPQRGSSREQGRNQHIPAESKSSEYSHHSRGTGSSSSGKAFVYGRDQNSRSQDMSQQRAAFPEPPQGGHSRNLSKEQKQSGNLASRRGRLRLSTDEDRKIDEEKKKSLEILIKGDETLHYTLTPESARAAEFESSDIRPKTETQDLADFIRNTAPPGDELERQPTPRQGKNGLRSNPPEAAPVTTALPTVPRSPSQTRNQMGAPRDARPERNTTRDLADYVRSTGPTSEQQIAQPLGTRPGTADVTRHGGVRSDGVPVAPSGNASLDSARPSTNYSERPVNRLKFQARDARPARNTETSELIDFIREGPPRAAGEHRIDRHVAPFRTTMDSDDLNALAPPPDVTGRGSVGSAPESAVTTKSVQESTNSRTALLDSTNRTNGRHVNASSASSGVVRQAAQEKNGMPPRTRRKARDPYELDDTDDELEAELLRPKPVKQEESLIDFLRNTAPPPGMAPQAIMAAAPRADTKPDIGRSASNSRLKDVLTRQTSVANGNRAPKAAAAAREESPHLTQVGSKLDKYRPTQPTHAAHVERNRPRPHRGEARDPTNNNSTTADLADYLKNTGPPEAPRPPEYSPTKDQAGFLKFFSRRGSVKR